MAIQFIPLIAAIVGGAATVGAGAYAYKSYQDKQPDSAPVMLKAEPEPKKEPEIKIVLPRTPEFHLLQVESDGSAVIAGSAPDNSKVEILHGDIVISETKAAGNGDFAIVTEKPLKPGTYELFIKATTTENKIVMSEQAGIISIPERGDEIIAMVSTPGKALKLIQIPEAKPVQKVEVTPEPIPEPEIEVKPEPEPAPLIIAKVEPEPVAPKIAEPKPVAKIVPTPAPKPVIVAKIEEPKPQPKPKKIQPVLLGAVEVENGKLFIAGTGEPGHIVNLYIDGSFIGTADVNSQGAYLLEVESSLSYGEHTVRADMSSKSNSVVLARAEVPLVHDAPPAPIVVAKAPEKKPEPVVTRKLVAPEPARNAGAVEIATAKPVEPKVEKPKRVIRTGSSVIIRKGDNLWRVSRRILGRGIRYSTIYNANKNQIKNPSLIFPGQIFKIPEKTANNGEVQEG